MLLAALVLLGAAGRPSSSSLPASLARARAEQAAALARARADQAAALARARGAAHAQTAAHRQAAVLVRRGVREAARLRAAEERESETAGRIETLAAQRDTDERRIAALTATLAAAIPAMEVLRAAPLGTVLGLPGSTATNAAGAAAVGGVAAAVGRELAELRARRAEADRLAASLAGERQHLAREHDRQVAEANRIEGAVRAARQDERSAASVGTVAARDAATSAAHASSLADAIAALAAAQSRADADTRVLRRRETRAGSKPALADAGGPGLAGGAVLPVAGPVVQRFGAGTDAGPASGVSIAPAPASLVSSPCRGTVLFAAPFRSYGRMAIVDCGQSWRFVLAGLATVDAAPGAHVRAGEPIGRMPDFVPGVNGRPTLYVQLRHGSMPVDPGRYLR